MTDWPDKKISSTALWYIRKHAMEPSTWRWTRLGEPHPEVLRFVELEVGELPVISFFRAEASWYLCTSRRVLGYFSGIAVEVAALDVVQDRFGNFKGSSGRETEVMTLLLADGASARLEYETAKASMAPIYYMRYWQRKYPILDKLKAEP
jgi:hypothetical protein